ncbi:hypothetical protein MS2017_2037 [Bathymodiolus thermophilus thioautotrophic gill symbiont]|uniref:Peptidase M15C domain-containing protein n=2 Tax=Bathymodiolus thermophilus thioautotrophic gill symbiont TaxID=2360 RepID=A0A3G3IPF3_9GAMM|nr:hypothetical protein MS2017_2037 [Bathymodiolus thermophilus thioautotrophic gill symbiont]
MAAHISTKIFPLINNKNNMKQKMLIFILGLLSAIACQAVTSKDNATNMDYDYQLPIQEFHFFNQIQKTGSATTTLTVSYKDYNGKTHKDGLLEIPAAITDQVKKLFNNLLTSGFLFQEIKPLSHYSNIFEAIKSNATFFFASNTGKIWLMVNPVNNPLIIRNDKNNNKKLTHHTHTSVDTTSNELTIFPAAGVLSVNVNQTASTGKLMPKILDVFSKYNFLQALQVGGNPDYLFFGLLGYKYNAPPSMPPKKIKMSSAPSIDPIFSYEPLPDNVKKALIASGSWKKGCPVSLERLNYVQFGYHGYDGNIAQGALVTADVVAPNILEIFRNFFKNKIKVEKPGGGKVGGTGMFICRKITGESGFSLHSYGTALDLSYYRNPYVGEYKHIKSSGGAFATGVIITPDSPLTFLNRNQKIGGFNEVHVDYIRSQGLSEWGGHWLNRTDYMHFQSSPFFSYLFPLIDYDSGRTLLTLEKNADRILHKFSIQSTEIAKWVLMVRLYPKDFAQMFVKNIAQFDALGEDKFYQMLYTKLQAQASK